MTRAPAVMVLGCTSGAGKSWLTTALCRWYARQGLVVKPFKAQNMSNHARVVQGATGPGGPRGEIGSAQYFQALAAGAARGSVLPDAAGAALRAGRPGPARGAVGARVPGSAGSALAAEVKSIAILTPEEGTDYGWNQQGVDAAKAAGEATGVKVTTVPFKGSNEAVSEVAAKRLDVFMGPPISVMPATWISVSGSFTRSRMPRSTAG